MRDSRAKSAFLHITATSRLLEKLRSDRKEIFRAAADAQRIADYLLAFHPDYANRQAGSPDNEFAAGDGDATEAPEPMSIAA